MPAPMMNMNRQSGPVKIPVSLSRGLDGWHGISEEDGELIESSRPMGNVHGQVAIKM